MHVQWENMVYFLHRSLPILVYSMPALFVEPPQGAGLIDQEL
jgi:hypothetical protein